MNKIISIFVLLLFTTTGFTQTEEPPKKKKEVTFLRNENKWKLELPLWVPGFRGEFTHGEIEVEGEDGGDPGDPGDPGDDKPGGGIIERLFSSKSYVNFFFMGRGFYANKNFIGSIDVVSINLGHRIKFNYNNKAIVDARFQTNLLRIYGGYSLLNHYTKSNKMRIRIYGFAGLRMHFFNIYSDLNKIVDKVDIWPTWVEPIVGVNARLDLKRWRFVVQSDIGGFRIKRKFSYMTNFMVYYKAGNLVSIKLGWTDWDIDHTGMVLGEWTKVKVHLSGPSSGVSFSF